MPYSIETCIIDMMESMGPQEESALKRECKTQATDYSEVGFYAALAKLASAEMIKAEVVGEDTNPCVYYDFPDSYYL